MNHRARRFVAEYIVDQDRKAAAIRAGYRPRRAAKTGYELLARPEIRFAVETGLRARAARVGLTRERVLLEYARIAIGDLGAVARWSEAGVSLAPLAGLGDDAAAAIREIGATDPAGTRLRVRLHDKGFALEALAQYFGLFDRDPAAEGPKGARDRLMARLKALAAED